MKAICFIIGIEISILAGAIYITVKQKQHQRRAAFGICIVSDAIIFVAILWYVWFLFSHYSSLLQLS